LIISYEVHDEIAGWQVGYGSKLLCDPPMERLGRMSPSALIGAPGLWLLVVEDREQIRN
jgi:hypothetical protein